MLKRHHKSGQHNFGEVSNAQMITFTHPDSYHNTCQSSWNLIFDQTVLPSRDANNARLIMTEREFFRTGSVAHWRSKLLRTYLKPLLNSFFYNCSSRQPRWVVELQTVQELLSDHLHGLSETLLQKKKITQTKKITDFKSSI